MTAHIGSLVDGRSPEIYVSCDRHGYVLETDNLQLAQAALRVHDLCQPPKRRLIEGAAS